ncbi:MFS transporter [Streptomonospora litoralis]|uniref:Inner membrane protein YbjJ n=1 Tax=Streptomonospora litoralis TaxID=2498135 RepID=A0A4P6Q9Y4_9ACTN|nr:MFS transporter [Streptomonospora litoralis]QBI56259.1 Inner membrane protein YbjJ [Streptomonospora litoralis]
MSVDVHTRPGPADQRARAAVAALFLTNGALFANLLPRFPEIKADLGMENAVYGFTVAAFPAGAIAAGLAAAALIRRWGSARAAVAGTLLTGLGLFAAGLAPSAAAFAAALLVAGAMDAITDVAQNAHGLRVQRRYGRSIINSFHALWSVGGVLGGSMAAAAIALEVPIGVHLGASAALFAGVSLVALRFCLPGRDDEPATAAEPGTDARPAPPRLSRARIVFVVTALVVIAMAGTIVEDAGNSWATLYLSDSLQAPAALAATGYIALVGAQFVGRLLGDRAVDRFGQRTVARTGGLIVAVGMGLALALPNVAGTIAGFAAAGFGVATLVPAAMHEADELPGLRPGTGLTIVSWLMRLGFLLSPPVVGLVSDAAGLRAGLLIARSPAPSSSPSPASSTRGEPERSGGPTREPWRAPTAGVTIAASGGGRRCRGR